MDRKIQLQLLADELKQAKATIDRWTASGQPSLDNIHAEIRACWPHLPRAGIIDLVGGSLSKAHRRLVDGALARGAAAPMTGSPDEVVEAYPRILATCRLLALVRAVRGIANVGEA